MKSLNLQFKGKSIYLFTGVISATAKRLDVSGFFVATRRRSPKEDYMHHRDVELKAIRLQSTKERRDTSYPRRGTPLKEPIRGCTSVQSMVLSVLSVLNKIFGCMRTSQSKYYSRTLNNRPLIRNNTYKTFFIDKLRVRGVSRK